MALIVHGRRQNHFGIAGQIDGAVPVAFIDQRHAADFHIVKRRDRDIHARNHPIVAAQYLDHVLMEHAFALVGILPGWCCAQRPKIIALSILQ